MAKRAVDPAGQKLSELAPVPLPPPGSPHPRIANDENLLYLVDLGPPAASYQITVRDLKETFGGLTGLAGDVTAGPGGGIAAATLAASGVTAGTYGDGATVPRVSVDAKGRVTGVALAPIPPAWVGSTVGQVPFPATAVPSTNPTTLDDYREGTWTPTLGGSSGQSGQAYTTQAGGFVKVGRLAVAWFDVQLSTKGTITGNVQLQGLPFPVQAAIGFAVGFYAGLSSAVSMVGGLATAGGTTATLYSVAGASATGMSVILPADVTNSLRVCGTLSYLTQT